MLYYCDPRGDAAGGAGGASAPLFLGPSSLNFPGPPLIFGPWPPKIQILAVQAFKRMHQSGCDILSFKNNLSNKIGCHIPALWGGKTIHPISLDFIKNPSHHFLFHKQSTHPINVDFIILQSHQIGFH